MQYAPAILCDGFSVQPARTDRKPIAISIATTGMSMAMYYIDFINCCQFDLRNALQVIM